MSERKDATGIEIILLALLALLVFFFLYKFRYLDDNRLTSWNIVFRSIDFFSLVPMFVAGALLSYVLSKHSIPKPYALLVLSFAVGTLFWREPEMLVDTSRYFSQAKHLELYGVGYFLREWGGQIVEWTDLPLVPFIYGLIFKVFGESRLFILVLTTSMYSLTVLLTCLTGRDLWDEDTGLTAGMLIMAMPFLNTQVPQMLVDVPSMFFLTLAIYSFHKAISKDGWSMAALSAFAISATILSKYTAWVLLSTLAIVSGVSIAISASGVRVAVLRRSVMVVFLGILIPLAFFIYKYGVVTEQIRFLIAYQKPGLSRWIESFKSTFLFQIHPFVTAAAIYSVFAAARRRDLKYTAILWPVALLLVLGVRRSRYLLPVFPMVALMASYGLQEFKSVKIRRFVAYLAVTASLVLSVFAFVPFLRTNAIANLMYAGRYLDAQAGDEVRVLTLPQRSVVNPAVSVPILDLYTQKKIIYDYELPTDLDEERIATDSLRFTWGYSNPAYYESYVETPALVAVITPQRHAEIVDNLEGYRILRRFEETAELYKYRPFVNVYGRSEINN